MTSLVGIEIVFSSTRVTSGKSQEEGWVRDSENIDWTPGPMKTHSRIRQITISIIFDVDGEVSFDNLAQCSLHQ